MSEGHGCIVQFYGMVTIQVFPTYNLIIVPSENSKYDSIGVE